MTAGIAVVVAGLALVVAAPSDAALVTNIGGTVGFIALPGEVNKVVVARDGNALVLDDEGSVLTVAVPGCVGIALHRVSCPGAQSVHLDLGDQNDTAVVNGRVPAWIDGGSGDDVLRGGDMGDVLDGGSGTDTVDYSNRTAPVTVTLDGKANDGGAGEGDNVLRVEHVVGGQGDDTLIGGPGNDVLDGGPGNDALAGEAGDDVLDGGPGRDGINALDPSPEPDHVDCGDGGDRVFADAQDNVAQDCETVDRAGTLGYTARVDPGPPAPELGKSVVVRPVSGTVLITPPPAGSDPNAARAVPALPPVPLDAPRNVPVGTVVDTRVGTVGLDIAVDRQGTTQSGEFSSGPFQVFQDPNGGGFADLALRGGKSFALCPRSGAGTARAAAARARRPGRRGAIRRLWGSAHGEFRTEGRYASATIRGTEWLTEDRCDGTLIRVRRGIVAVTDPRSGLTVLVTAGHRYLVSAGS